MSRKSMPRELPALRTLYPDFKGFPSEVAGVHALREALRKTVRDLAGARPRPFYAQRDLAAFFGVTRRTATLACRALVREGLLRTRAGAGTWVAGRRGAHLTTVRGVVGLPLWVQGFVNFAEWRMFFVLLEERLRREDFAPEIIFYGDEEAGRPEMALRLARHRLDQVVWFTPDSDCLHILQGLEQQGTRVTVVADSTVTWPFTCYQLDWRGGVLRGLQAWAEEGIEAVVTVLGQSWLKELVRCAGMRLAGGGRAAVERLMATPAAAPRTAVVLDDDYATYHFCRSAPEALGRLLAARRVMTLRGLDLVPAQREAFHVDAVLIDWERLAVRLVADMAAERLPSPGRPVKVQAAYYARTPVDRLPSARYQAGWV